MQRFEYKVIATPRKLKRVKGLKGPQARFAHILTETMNEYAVDGWEYVRAENLPVDEKQGLFKGTLETYQSVLVFRRVLGEVAEVVAPVIAEESNSAPEEEVEPEIEGEPAPQEEPALAEDLAPARPDEPVESNGASDPLVEVAEGDRR